MKTFFTPGPSQLYKTVPMHIQRAIEQHIPSISHRSALFQEITREAITNFRELFSIPEDYHIFFLSSATEAMERIIQNCVIEKSVHITAGSFGEKFYEIAVNLKKDAKQYKIDLVKPYTNPFKIPQDTELICVTQNETSNGWAFPVEKIYDLKKKYPDTLLAVDIVSSMPYINLDYTQIDLAFFSIQKGFGLPAGLGIVIVSPKAFEKAISIQKSGINIGSYHSFPSLAKHMEKYQTPETPNVLNIYLFNAVLKDFISVGIKKIRQETDEKAKLLYTFLEEHTHLHPVIPISDTRSKTIIVASGENLSELLTFLSKNNFTLGKGYGKEKNTQMRIANFPTHSKITIKKLITKIQEFYSL